MDERKLASMEGKYKRKGISRIIKEIYGILIWFRCFKSALSVTIHNYYQMQDSSSLLKLPRREYGIALKFGNSQRREFVSNYYQVKLDQKNSTIYQFSYQTVPPIPQDSKELLYQALRSVKKELREKIRLVTSSGNIIWGVKGLSMALSLSSEFKFEETAHKFQVFIKQTKTLNIPDLMATPEGLKLVLQVFNNKLKEKLREKKMDEITRGKYFDKKEVQIHNVGLSVLRGFKFTLCPLKRGLTLQIDVCSRVFRSHNLLEEMGSMNKDEIDNLVGSTIITRYGKVRTYTILKIDHSQSPSSEFYHDKRAGKVKFAQYYEESYGLKVRTMKQPLIEVCLRVEKKLTKQGMEKTEVKGFLIPEFVALTGMSEEQRKNFSTMKEIAPYTKLTPQERMIDTDKIKEYLGGTEDFRLGNPMRMPGIQLNEPEVRLQTQSFRSKDGTLRFKDRVKVPVAFKDWVLVYSQGKNSKYDDEDADNFVSLLQQASKTFGIDVSAPGFITTSSNINSMKEQINKDIKANGKPQIIVFLLNPNEERFYPELKRFLICDLKINSQFIRKRTVSAKSKNPMSAASMIAIQMNQKVGGTTWEVQKRNEYLEKRKMMYGAFSISKGRKGFTVAFVGTINSECTKVVSYCKTGYKRKEDIPKADFDTIFLHWAKTFVMENKEGPSIILIYREGLSIPQIEVQIKPEVDALYDVIKKIGEKTKKLDYKPEVMYMTVNKKINARIFESMDNGNSQGKFIPKVNNPPSGSCVFDELSVDKQYDFHLTAQKVTQGTCTPTQYIVVHNDSKIPQQSLAQFTYEQCFNYYNWQGAVKVPACMQNADKLAKLVGESVQANITEGDILKGFFFL